MAIDSFFAKQLPFTRLSLPLMSDLNVEALREILLALQGETITVVTNVQYDTGTHKFQMKTRQVACVTIAAESAWTDIVALDACVP